MKISSAVIAGLFGAAFAPAPAFAEDFVIDPAHSFVQFSVDRFGFSAVIGEFRAVSGTVSLHEATPSKSAVAASVTTASLDSGDALRDRHLKGKLWFDADAYPTIAFRSTEVKGVNGDHAKVKGVLSLHGVDAPITLDVTLNKIGKDPATGERAAGFSARAKLKRSDFGMKTAAALIGEDVDIRIEALTHAKVSNN